MKVWLTAALMLFSLAQCAGSQLASSEWQSPLFQSHLLVGQIWRARDGSFIDDKTLREELTQADYLLLGEKHDNPDHHRLKRQLLAQLQPDVALVSFEMLDHGQQAQLDGLAGTVTESTDIKTALDWDDVGWDWEFYGPLLSALLAEGVPLRAANISQADVMAAYAGELDPTAATVLTPEELQLLEQEIDASHCGMLPASQFAAMVRVQQARDYQMAHSLLDDRSASGEGRTNAGLRVLVAGNYHVRKDLGVPKYLQAINADADESLSVAFLEVAESMTDPQTVLATQYAADTFDYVWFTPAAAEQDYCAAFQ